jgi:hypothetical protein
MTKRPEVADIGKFLSLPEGFLPDSYDELDVHFLVVVDSFPYYTLRCLEEGNDFMFHLDELLFWDWEEVA